MPKDNDAMQVMPQAVAIIYKELFDELKSAKQQQWTITNYLLAALAAIFGVAKSLGRDLSFCEKTVATALATLALVCVLSLLVKIQCQMKNTRRRLDRVEAPESNYFSANERDILELKPSADDPARRGLLFLAVLVGASLVGDALVSYALWFSKGG